MKTTAIENKCWSQRLDVASEVDCATGKASEEDWNLYVAQYLQQMSVVIL